MTKEQIDAFKNNYKWSALTDEEQEEMSKFMDMLHRRVQVNGERRVELSINWDSEEECKLCVYCESEHHRPQSEFCSDACEDNYVQFGVEE